MNRKDKKIWWDAKRKPIAREDKKNFTKNLLYFVWRVRGMPVYQIVTTDKYWNAPVEFSYLFVPHPYVPAKYNEELKWQTCYEQGVYLHDLQRIVYND